MILKITLNDEDHMPKLLKACNTLGTAIHRKRFIVKEQENYEISDFELFDYNKNRIEKCLSRSYEDLGREDKLWFMKEIGKYLLYYFSQTDLKDIEFYSKNLDIQITDTYKDVKEYGISVYVFVFSSKITPAIFTIKQ